MSDHETPSTGALPDAVDDDLAGVQGEDDRADSTSGDGDAIPPAGGQVGEEHAPDAAEIEWAGTVVKKPPHPAN